MPTLNWIGKDKIITHHQEVPVHELVHQYGFTENGKQEDLTDSGNMIIHGDNLVALKSLLPTYENRVDCIYIDPPYNTGNENWVYNDNVNDPRILEWLGKVVGKEGEDLTRHDKWLCMMYPRLQLMKKLLSEKGVIFISIDDNEVSHLRKICDEIFGVGNFVADIIWHKTYSPRNDSKGVPTETDHILVYSKKQGWQPKRLERTEEMNSVYKNPDNDISLWRNSDAFAPEGASHQGMVYAIQHPFTGEMIYPYRGAHWPLEQSAMFNAISEWGDYEYKDLHDEEKRAQVCGVPVEEIRQGVVGIILKDDIEVARKKAEERIKRYPWPRFFFTKNGYGGIARKTYLNNVEGKLITTFWDYDDVGHTDEAKKELKRIFSGDSPFETPKPSRLIKRIIESSTEPESIVLDAFGGSGTTAHSTIIQNLADNGCRKFILIELMDYADSTTAERVKRVIQGYPFIGKKKYLMFSKKLTAANLKHFQEYYSEALKVVEDNKDLYSKISKPTVKDNNLIVEAENEIKERMPGLGGKFDFYEIGEPLYIHGLLNPNVSEESLRKYVFYTETKKPLIKEKKADEPYYLDTYNDTAYYFFYDKENETILKDSTLSDVITTKKDISSYIIYADSCLLSEEKLKRFGIKFKKIPRDIQKY